MKNEPAIHKMLSFYLDSNKYFSENGVIHKAMDVMICFHYKAMPLFAPNYDL